MPRVLAWVVWLRFLPWENCLRLAIGVQNWSNPESSHSWVKYLLITCYNNHLAKRSFRNPVYSEALSSFCLCKWNWLVFQVTCYLSALPVLCDFIRYTFFINFFSCKQFRQNLGVFYVSDFAISTNKYYYLISSMDAY